jgi:hypothetical protein
MLIAMNECRDASAEMFPIVGTTRVTKLRSVPGGFRFVDGGLKVLRRGGQITE